MHAAGMNESSMGGMEGKKIRKILDRRNVRCGWESKRRSRKGGRGCVCMVVVIMTFGGRGGGKNEWISSGSDWLEVQPSSSLDITVDGQQE